MSAPAPVPLARRLRSALFHALRLAFRAVPMGQARRDALREWFLDRFPRIRPALPQGQSAPALERRPRVHSGGRAIGYVERRDEPLPDPLPATLVAFYLPQFHTIPENDQWWGKGFTEWRNVARALPQFEGHAQPRLPGDRGFYDLRNPQVLRDQAELAQAYGIGAFCMYFYWFGGKTLLELPHQQWLNDPSITLPICLCWANENWTRTWDGRAEEVLVAQQHSPGDDLAFIAHVAQYLRDPRYLRVDGKPLLLLYRPGKLPDARATTDRWRAWCRDNGIGEIFLAYVQSFERPDPRDIGFDAAVEFPPNLSTATNITDRQTLLNPDYQGEVLDWRDVARDFSNRPMPPYTLFPGVNCGWDNEPRRPGRGRTYLHASPRGYRDWLQRTLHQRLADVPAAHRFVFVNAWNEWAEGAVLEPDARHGFARLAAVRAALAHRPEEVRTPAVDPAPCAVIHAWYPDVLDSMLDLLERDGRCWRLVVTTAPEREAEVRRVLQRHASPAELHVFDNRGRDILPFLRVAGRLLDRGEDVVLKLHTKRSPHRRDGERWRDEMVQALVHPTRSDPIAAMFEQDPGLGMVAPEGHMLPLASYMGANLDAIGRITARSGLDRPQLDDPHFLSGSMGWLRLPALRPLLDLDLAEDEFEPERGQVDGTLAHALERTLSLVMAAQGYRIATAADVCGDRHAATAAAARRYPYARPD